jgi:hypothetical protein
MPLVGRSTNTTATHSSAPLGTLEAHPVCCSMHQVHSTHQRQRTPTTGTDSVSRESAAAGAEHQWHQSPSGTDPIARFLRVFDLLCSMFYTNARLFLRVFTAMHLVVPPANTQHLLGPGFRSSKRSGAGRAGPMHKGAKPALPPGTRPKTQGQGRHPIG